MRRSWLAVLTLAFWPGFVMAQSVTLPAEIKGSVGAWVIIAPQKVDGGKVKWRVDPGLQDVDLGALLPPEFVEKLRGRVVTATKAGRYRVEAWNAKGDVASDIATCWIVIGDPGPVDPPKPDPPVPAGKMASFVLGVTNNDARTQTEAAILMSDSLAGWLGQNKIPWRVYDDDSVVAKDAKIADFLASQGVSAPAVIGWFDGVPKAVDAPQTVDAVKLFVQGKALQKLFIDPKGLAFSYFQAGDKRWLTRVPPPADWKGAGAKRFKDAIGVIPRSQWKDIDRRASFPASWTLDQNGHGSCVGQGSVAALQRVRHQSGMSFFKLSPTCVYAQINGGQDNGAIIGDSLEALQKTGTILFDKFGQNKIYLNQLPTGWRTEATRFKIEQAFTVRSFDEQVSAIQLGYIVVNCCMVGSNFDNYDKYGVAGYANGQGNHCLMADGCKKLPDGRWVLDIQNSWGESWGPWRNGRCYFEQRHIDNSDNSDCYAIKTATEDPMEIVRPPLFKTATEDPMEIVRPPLFKSVGLRKSRDVLALLAP